MKLNKHVMAMNLAAVLAFGAIAGIVAPAVAGEDNIVAYAATSDGDAGVTGGNAEVKPATDASDVIKNSKLAYNEDGKTATLKEADKTAKKLVFEATFKDADGKEITITEIDPKAFDGVAAKSIDISKIKVTKLPANLFSGAKKATSVKINAKGIKRAKDINKNFAKGAKKLKKINVIATKKQWKTFKKKFEKAAKQTKNKKGTKVKKVSK